MGLGLGFKLGLGLGWDFQNPNPNPMIDGGLSYPPSPSLVEASSYIHIYMIDCLLVLHIFLNVNILFDFPLLVTTA